MLVGVTVVAGQGWFPALLGWPVLRVLGRGVGGWWSGCGQGAESGVGSGDLVGPGPGWVDVEGAAAGGAHDPPGHGQDPQSQPFRLVGRDRGGQCEADGPGEQVGGQGGDGEPDPVLRHVVDCYLEPICPGP